jgi:hypothetical protein
LARIGAVWRHRPRSGVLVFFDEQPIAVKAYGGRRYTLAQHLEIPRNQKTRGLFQLFGLYEVNRGRVRWAFHPDKNSAAVASFMRQVRRWYPTQEVWVILDQDSTHPRKSGLTRQVMRQLQLHWISLPKRSPNDNPLETLFSDVQQMVLDASNDPDARTTQKRISAHWRKRNRRKDRFIHIPYLPGDSHKL